jgi:peptide/nickel transport system substrate-binding protein
MNPFIDYHAFSAFGEHPIYSPLFRMDTNGALKPCLAVNCTTTNGVDFVINLVDNASFHSGTPFTADDAVATLEVIKNNTPPLDPFWNAAYGLSSGMIESVEKLGDYQIAIHLDHTYLTDWLWWDNFPNFYRALDRLPMLRKDIVENLVPNGPIDGTGPWVLSAFHPGKNMTLTANPDYFLGRPYLDNITYRWDYSIDQFPQAILDNEVDVANFAYDFADPTEVSKTSGVPGVSTRSITKSQLWYLAMNQANPHLANQTIRQAIYKAIDQQAICNGPFQGYADPAIGYVCPGFKEWYNPSVVRYAYDPVAAQQVLGDSNLSLTLIVGDWDEYRAGIGTLIAQNLRGVGVNITLRELNWDDFFSIYNYYSPGDYDLAIEDLLWLGYDPDNEAYMYWYTDWWYARVYSFSNSTIDYMIEQARLSLEKPDKQKWHNWIQGNISSLCPMAFLCWNRLTIIQNNDFYGLTESSSINLCDSIVLENVYYQPTLSSEGKSPMHFVIIDSEGRKTGAWNGSIYEDISGSVSKPEENLTLVPYPVGTYHVWLNGTADGTYSLEFVNLGFGYRFQNVPMGTIREGQIREYVVTVSPGCAISVTNCAVDLDGDKDCDIFDIVVMVASYGSTPANPEWNMLADVAPPINQMDIYDVVAFVAEYGKDW